MEATNSTWPAIATEVLPWERSPEDLALVPKSRRRKILPQDEAAVPASIAGRQLELPDELHMRIAELTSVLARYDERTARRGFDLPDLMLRSESSSSSQIESLTSSVRNVALAELTTKAPRNARLIANNVSAMRRALELEGDLSTSMIVEVQRVLMGYAEGGLRQEQVWIGGTPYSPHGAEYVPPAWERVPALLEDLCAFARRDDIPTIAKAAVAHAQFEAIHPFVDGNGRTGRALLHRILRQDGVLTQATLPLSAGLLHNADAYLGALAAYQQGDAMQVVTCVADAMEKALAIGYVAERRLDAVIADWRERITERQGSAIHGLPQVLARHPVVNTTLVSEQLGITARAAQSLVARAEELGMISRMGNARRGAFWQAGEILQVLEDVASRTEVRRLLAGEVQW